MNYDMKPIVDLMDEAIKKLQKVKGTKTEDEIGKWEWVHLSEYDKDVCLGDFQFVSSN